MKGNKPRHIFAALLIGFSASFALLLVIVLSGPLIGSIMVGTVPLSMKNPTVAGAGLANPQVEMMLQSLGSFWFWSVFAVVGVFLSFKTLQWFRGVDALEI